MRALAAILLFACLLAAAFAEVPFSVSYQMGFMLPPRADYSVDGFAYGNDSTFIVLWKGHPYAIFLPSAQPGKFEPVADEKKIAAMLGDYYLSNGYSPSASDGMDAAHQKIMGIKDARKIGEEKCRVLLGTDRSPCFDFFSCQRACYSVTSFCLPVALGADRPFINTISEFENATTALDSAYAYESAAYGEWKNNSTGLSMQNYLHSIELLNKAATRAHSSYLYDWYSYCFRPDYSLAAITAIQLDAQKDYRNASRFLTLADDASAAAEVARIGISRRLSAELAFNLSLEANLSRLQNLSASQSRNGTLPPASPEQATAASIQQPQEAAGIAVLAIGAALILILAAVLIIYLKRKGRAA